jgi:hypothetical protein
MAWKRKISGGLLAVVGYLLSPLSWWNDAFVNLPLAVGFAWLVSAFYQPAFGCCVVVGYWLTNILGLILLHKGAQRALSKQEKRYSVRDLARDIAISLLYTALIVALLQLGVLKPLQGYLPARSGG